MNWLIQKKMLTYFYNKFSPVSRMHYIKCGVSTSLLIILVAAEGLWHLGSLFYHDTYYSQRGWFTNLLLCDIPRNKAPRTGPHHIWRIYTLCPFFGREKKHTRQCSWVDDFACQCLLWRFSSRKTFVAAALSLPTNLGVGRSWLFPASSIKSLTRRSLKSWWVYLAPHEDNIIQLLSSVRSRKWKNNFMVRLKVRRLIK